METAGQNEKTNFQVKMDAATRDHLYELFDAAGSTRGEVMERLVPAIEAALSVDVPDSIQPDVESIKGALSLVESRVGAIAAQYGTIEDAVAERHREQVENLSEIISDLQTQLKDESAAHAATVKDITAQLDQAREEVNKANVTLSDTTIQLEEERQRAAAQAHETAEWRRIVERALDEKDAQIEQMKKDILDKETQVQQLKEELKAIPQQS